MKIHKMERWFGKVAIVTGASSGIGASIAFTLAKSGLKVVGLARRVEKIEELAVSVSLRETTGELFALKCDLTIESDILEAFKWTTDNVGPVSILINNAGRLANTTLIDGDTADWRQTFDVNVIALCICTREAIRIMTHNDISGHIVHINSISGHYPLSMPAPILSVYPASKYAVTALTESLRQELRYRKSSIRVSGISPGVVGTDIFQMMGNEIEEEVLKGPTLTAEDVTEAVVYALSAKPNVQVHDIMLHPLLEAI